jgi:hypothetical protein
MYAIRQLNTGFAVLLVISFSDAPLVVFAHVSNTTLLSLGRQATW